MDAKLLNTQRLILRENPGWQVVDEVRWPRWLKCKTWVPSFVLSKGKRIMAVAVELSGTVPRKIYRDAVPDLLDNHRNLSVLVCIPDRRADEDPDLPRFCKSIGVEVHAVIPSVGTEVLSESMVVPSNPAPQPPTDGQFPKAVLDSARGLKRLCFSAILDSFIDEISHCAGDNERALSVVKTAIDKLLASHPNFRVEPMPFMRLASFENLLVGVGVDSSDHVFHSFRVFLAGCPVVNQFYTLFQKAQKRFTLCPSKQIRVEYIWLLTSLFHDIGRVKEALPAFASQVTGGDDMSEWRGKPERWAQGNYQDARRILGSLGACMVADGSARWDGGLVEDERGVQLGQEWIDIYDTYKRHGVMSAFDLMADVARKMKASGERANRLFTVSHVAPAALAMLFHQWQLWSDARGWGLFPVDMQTHPLAALLLYSDTWDDFKRRAGDPPIAVPEYSVDKSGVRVVVEWQSEAALGSQSRKYTSFAEALTGGPPSFLIDPRVRRP